MTSLLLLFDFATLQQLRTSGELGGVCVVSTCEADWASAAAAAADGGGFALGVHPWFASTLQPACTLHTPICPPFLPAATPISPCS